MEDRNKDLPLIVSEMLIEMHEMKEDIRIMKEDIRAMTKALNQTAAVVLKQQEHTNTLLTAFQEESKTNMEFMTYSISKALGQQQTVNQDFEVRLQRLEQQHQL